MTAPDGCSQSSVIKIKILMKHSECLNMAAKVNVEECTGGGLCADECPAEAITISEEGYAVVDEDECTECGACTDVCPNVAITL